MAKRVKDDSVRQMMIVNDVPGEECRIAILEDHRLEELYTERVASATGVGNIHKGRVINVEPAIQAAFIDYGEGKNGFLHISDLHPRYFPGEERTERVGRKIPRRERPPIQQALKRGDEILVQVIKEGIGTKGPTLTSYLSIPGRLMVMMPHMDNVGVSRKIEDEEKRRAMRDILDSLELPEGFGFILRTAGFDRTKTELKRDLAYLTRLWKKMEKRIESVSAPCALYTESDLLIRTIRDVLSQQVQAIVVDSESAYDRTRDFLSIIAPRSAPRIVRYRGPTPIFHAFDIERQIELIHQREVPLPSGGAVVIEQTEALVAIDVNSGRSRSARDSESNAFNTNKEAVDEICRQLRLRDLGGLIVMDLIDMNAAAHRRAIEDRMRDHLKRDRAKTTVLRLSEFGIMQMTRQRMRPSLRKSHFQACPTCHGRGEIRNPETIAADALRHAGYLAQYDRVKTIELVCPPRVASVLLSSKRRALVRLEDETDKIVHVRVSETIELDRVNFFAYDERSADIDIDQLPPPTPLTLHELESRQTQWAEEERTRDAERAARRSAEAAARGTDSIFEFTDDDLDLDDDEHEEDIEPTALEAARTAPAVIAPASGGEENGTGKKKRRRRRRRRGGAGRNGEAEGVTPSSESDSPASTDTGARAPVPASTAADESDASESGGRKKRRRRRRRRCGGEGAPASEHAAQASHTDTDDASASDDDADTMDTADSGASEASPTTDTAGRKKRRRRKKAASKDESAPSLASSDSSPRESARPAAPAESTDTSETPEPTPGSSKKTRSRSRKKAVAPKSSSSSKSAGAAASTADEPAKSAPGSRSSSASKAGSAAVEQAAAKPRRSLYRSRAKVSAGALKSLPKRED